ncbi:MAG: succinylglutamate desuccinylase/aspartoacylase family protein [Acidobacteria bacterium]|nr:succinylglutamate desuccinylase/aspartoacylase family protein [Acidobacteriota bacterium]
MAALRCRGAGRAGRSSLLALLLVVVAGVLAIEAAREAAQIAIPSIPPETHDVRPGPGVKTRALSDYLPGLAGTPGDTPVYVLEGPEPGGTAFVAGGTHANEIAGIMTAIVLVEHGKVRRGRLLVVPHANNSAVSWQDPKMPTGPRTFTVKTASGVRAFSNGTRLTKPEHQGEPDPPAEQAPTPEYAFDSLFRNLDRQYPGKANGNLTQRIAYAVMTLIQKEKVEVAFDLHEAPPGARLAMMVVANPKNLGLAAAAVLALDAKDLSMKLEPSSSTFRGLSHREWGDGTQASAFLFETPNPAFAFGGKPGDPVNDPEWPLAKRVGIHCDTLLAVLDAYNEGVAKGRQVVLTDLPSTAAITKTGLGPFMR